MAAQNNAPATGGITGKGFQPGQSGNPGGRPKGLARRVRDEVPETDLIEFQRAVLYCDADLLSKWGIGRDDVRLQDRQAAHQWLTERGHGKAPSFAPIEGEDALGLDTVDRAIDSGLDELAPLREAKAVGTVANGVVAASGKNGAAPA